MGSGDGRWGRGAAGLWPSLTSVAGDLGLITSLLWVYKMKGLWEISGFQAHTSPLLKYLGPTMMDKKSTFSTEGFSTLTGNNNNIYIHGAPPRLPPPLSQHPLRSPGSGRSLEIPPTLTVLSSNRGSTPLCSLLATCQHLISSCEAGTIKPTRPRRQWTLRELRSLA